MLETLKSLKFSKDMKNDDKFIWVFFGECGSS